MWHDRDATHFVRIDRLAHTINFDRLFRAWLHQLLLVQKKVQRAIEDGQEYLHLSRRLHQPGDRSPCDQRATFTGFYKSQRKEQRWSDYYLDVYFALYEPHSLHGHLKSSSQQLQVIQWSTATDDDFEFRLELNYRIVYFRGVSNIIRWKEEDERRN